MNHSLNNQAETKIAEALEGCRVFKNFTYEDCRGFFRKVIPAQNESFESDFPILQVNLSSNNHAGTIRGLHYQTEPYLESKFVSCLRGSIFDVLLDLRPDSVTYGKYTSYLLTPETGSLLVPPLVAHGFQSLENETLLLYLHSNIYNLKSSKGINPLDPVLAIAWPLPVSIISENDKNSPNFFK